ncbi:MAG: hypothetical protein WC882_03025 [Candidatus Gracilibacteria bacterium]
MRRIFIIFIFLVVIGPFLVSVYLNSNILQTERLNLQRNPAFFSVTPFNPPVIMFEAKKNFLSEIHIFMHCPDPIFPSRDHYIFLVENNKTGEEYASFDLSPIDFWNDIATLKFTPIQDSQGQTFTITIRADTSNTSMIQMAIPATGSSEFISQPYYEQDTSFFEALYIVLWERLFWRILPVFPLFFFLWALIRKIILPPFDTIQSSS